jgi:hypothetical protein
VEADAGPEGCAPGFLVREDFAAGLGELGREIRDRGGVLTSSGGARELTAEVTEARSPVSLHYLGRAIDLCIWSGMQTADDPYLVIEETNEADADRPFWRVFGAGSEGAPDTMGLSREACLWRAEEAPDHQSRPDGTRRGAGEGSGDAADSGGAERGAALIRRGRSGRFFDLTALLADRGWGRIPARPCWPSNYLCVEWWHFERHDGLVAGVTTFGEELRRVHRAETIAASPLVASLDRVWDGRYFAPV